MKERLGKEIKREQEPRKSRKGSWKKWAALAAGLGIAGGTKQEIREPEQEKIEAKVSKIDRSAIEQIRKLKEAFDSGVRPVQGSLDAAPVEQEEKEEEYELSLADQIQFRHADDYATAMENPMYRKVIEDFKKNMPQYTMVVTDAKPEKLRSEIYIGKEKYLGELELKEEDGSWHFEVGPVMEGLNEFVDVPYERSYQLEEKIKRNQELKEAFYQWYEHKMPDDEFRVKGSRLGVDPKIIEEFISSRAID